MNRFMMVGWTFGAVACLMALLIHDSNSVLLFLIGVCALIAMAAASIVGGKHDD